MSNRAKLLVSLLFIAVIILCAGLTRFYFDVTKNTDYTDINDQVVRLLKTYDNGMQSFESTNGYCGVLDKDGAVIIEPEWMEILEVTPNMVLVSERMQDEILVGGIDFEENVILPFTFRSMENVYGSYYIGTVADDESCIIYNGNFEPVFRNSWESAEYDNGMLLLEKDGCTFSYYIAEEQPIFRRAQMVCDIGTEQLRWNISNRIYLAEFTPQDLLRMNECVSSYISMLIDNDFANITDISAVEYSTGLSKIDRFKGEEFLETRGFSFAWADEEKKTYDFSFIIRSMLTEQPADKITETAESTEAVTASAERDIIMHLYFQRNASNQMILTSADFDYRSTQQ